MNCQNCNNLIPEGVAVCPFCGAQQEAAQPQYIRPAYQLKTNRGLCKMFFLSIITFGIYGIVNLSQMADEINITASRYDGRKTMPYFASIFLTMYTFGIFSLFWSHNFSKRIGDEARRRGYNTTFGAKDFWLWNVLGAFIFIGPFVFLHKLTKTMNMVNESYNYYG